VLSFTPPAPEAVKLLAIYENHDSDHLVIPCSALTKAGEVRTTAFLDSGGSATAYITKNFVQQHKLPLIPLLRPKTLELADGSTDHSLTHMALLDLAFGDHLEQLTCYVVDNLGAYNLILGIKWHDTHDPDIRWSERTVTFRSSYCLHHCLLHHLPVTVQQKGYIKRDEAANTLSMPELQTDNLDPETSESRPIPSIVPTPPLPKPKPKPPDRVTKDPGHFDIKMVSSRAFMMMARRTNHKVMVINPARDFDWTTEQRSLLKRLAYLESSNLSKMSISDYDKFNKATEYLTREQLQARLPPQLKDMHEVFNKRQANTLPAHTAHDFKIDLKPGTTLPYKRPYGMSREELAAVKKYIDENLSKGFIRPSTAEGSSPVLLVKKPGGGLRFCVDYRGLNAITIKNRYPIPLIRETLDRLCKAKRYTKLDVIGAFNRLRVRDGDQELTTFTTRYGAYMYEVMPFGVCNGPGSFQSYINSVLREYLDLCACIYLDDVLVYTDGDEAEHYQQVRNVLKRLQDAGLYCDINKSEFNVKSVKFLGLIITTNGLKMDIAKIRTIQDWQTPKNVHDVLSFLGFCNFYRRFIQGFSKLAAPLTEMTKGISDWKPSKLPPFLWTKDHDLAFQKLKEAFDPTIMLCHFDPTKPTWLETDASDWVVAGVLSQMHDGILKPVAFYSKKMSPAECNYEIYDKELLAIVRAFEEWRPELAGLDSDDPTRVITDHRNLQWFMSTKQLNQRQTRWSEFLSQFHFQIQYRPGLQGTKPDSLTRRTGDVPQEGDYDKRHAHRSQQVLKPQFLAPGVNTSTSSHKAVQLSALMFANFDIEHTIKKSYKADPLIAHVKTSFAEKALHKDVHSAFPGYALGDFKIDDQGMLFIDHRLYVPQPLRLEIIRSAHESKIGGHGGRTSTYDLLHRNYCWPKMVEEVSRFVAHCRRCLRIKKTRQKKYGLLQSLPPVDRPFQHLTMDFIVDLPPSSSDNNTYTNILIVVCRLTKRRKFVPMTTITARELAKVYEREVWKEWGFPQTIVTDRGTQFLSDFWLRLCERIGTRPKLSTAYHPETDGQSEIANAFLEQYLRGFCNYAQSDWVELLPSAEFFSNNKVNSSTGVSPFFASYHCHPRTGIEPPDPNLGKGPTKFERTAADDLVARKERLWQHLRDEIEWASSQHAIQANKKRQATPDYKVGDEVMLSTKNIRTERPSAKLDHTNMGPFSIKRIVHDGRAFELDLPANLKFLHPVFHPNLLTPLPNKKDIKPLPGQVTEPPPPVKVLRQDGIHDEWYVEEILDSGWKQARGRAPKNGKRQMKLWYLVKWEGFDVPTWQDASKDLTDCNEHIADYHHHNPNAAGPRKGFGPPPGWKPPSPNQTTSETPL
jgi:hypothetical protein